MFQAILNAIVRYDTIIIHRHKNPDGDAMGSQIGLKHILLENFPEKKIYVVGDDARSYGFMDDSQMDVIDDSVFDGALAVILDSGSRHLISDERYATAAHTVRFDHHIFCEKIADNEVVDTSFESCCGLVAQFALESGLRLNPKSAKALYTGMVTDSGRFRYDGVSGETMRCAGVLLDVGVDTERLFARLYLEAFEYLKFKSEIYRRMQITPNGVAYIYIDKAMQEEFNLSLEQASACIGSMVSSRSHAIHFFIKFLLAFQIRRIIHRFLPPGYLPWSCPENSRTHCPGQGPDRSQDRG